MLSSFSICFCKRFNFSSCSAVGSSESSMDLVGVWEVIGFISTRILSNAFIITSRFTGFFKYKYNPYFFHSLSSVSSRSIEENKKTLDFLNISFSLSKFKIWLSLYSGKGISIKTI